MHSRNLSRNISLLRLSYGSRVLDGLSAGAPWWLCGPRLWGDGPRRGDHRAIWALHRVAGVYKHLDHVKQKPAAEETGEVACRKN